MTTRILYVNGVLINVASIRSGFDNGDEITLNIQDERSPRTFRGPEREAVIQYLRNTGALITLGSTTL